MSASRRILQLATVAVSSLMLVCMHIGICVCMKNSFMSASRRRMQVAAVAASTLVLAHTDIQTRSYMQERVQGPLE